MAVDLIVSPLSKYWSGDYITPVMSFAWEMGQSYNVVTPKGIKTLPEGTPYGGEDAPVEREELIPFVEKLMGALPFPEAAGAWDERSDHFGFHRVDPAAFGEIQERGGRQFTRRAGIFARLVGGKHAVSHLERAGLFLPIDFDTPFDIEGKIFGSLPAARKELNGVDRTGIPPEALHPIIAAFEEAFARKLPLSVDL
jgi:hypothetical protein